ncbi:MAG: response regulator [Chloroflexi bacterium]|nr:response regulator [Chloroflexota bacterium]
MAAPTQGSLARDHPDAYTASTGDYVIACWYRSLWSTRGQGCNSQDPLLLIPRRSRSPGRGCMGMHMDERSAARADFVDLVRDALLHLYDLTTLQTHRLAAVVARPGREAPARGQGLRKALLDAIGSVHPGAGVPTTSRAWRTYRLLELRYIEGLDVAAVSDQLALGRSHYHREHHRALQAVADALWERVHDQMTSGSVVVITDWAEPERVPLPSTAESRGQVTSVAESLDLGAITRDICVLLEPLCAQRGVGLQWSPPAVPVMVYADRVALRQALLMLSAPVIEGDERGVVTVALAAQDGWAQVTIGRPVTADGPSVAPADAGARPFVEAIRGRLSFLPTSTQTDTWGVQLSLPSSSGAELLVVDNSVDFIRLVERALSGSAWEVVGASDVDRALRAVAEHRPRAILLDIVLPGHDGWEFLQALKREPATRHIPIIVCSVLGQPSVAIALGAAAYLQKPVDGPRLMAALSPYADVDGAVK